MGPRGTPIDANAALALDSKALESLKAQAKSAPDKALSQAAGQFEALFVSMVLKSMRDALPQDGPLASETTKTYTAMFDQQLALKLSDRGIGLRKAIEKQLARSLPAPAAADAAATVAPPPAPSPSSTLSPPAAPSARVRRAVTAYAMPATAARATAAVPGPAPSPPTPTPTKDASSVASTVSAFVDKLRPYAETAAKALGVPVQFLLAQAGLETGWGRSSPKAADGASSHNLFGMKAGRSWSGRITQAKTTEYVQGAPTPSTDAFRSYGSYAESFQDFVKLIKGSRRYADALAHANDASGYAKSLQRAGYATDPAYAQKLTRAIALVNRHAGPSPPAQVMAGGADTRTDRA